MQSPLWYGQGELVVAAADLYNWPAQICITRDYGIFMRHGAEFTVISPPIPRQIWSEEAEEMIKRLITDMADLSGSAAKKLDRLRNVTTTLVDMRAVDKN